MVIPNEHRQKHGIPLSYRRYVAGKDRFLNIETVPANSAGTRHILPQHLPTEFGHLKHLVDVPEHIRCGQSAILFVFDHTAVQEFIYEMHMWITRKGRGQIELRVLLV